MFEIRRSKAKQSLRYCSTLYLSRIYQYHYINGVTLVGAGAGRPRGNLVTLQIIPRMPRQQPYDIDAL